jgi:uncharacterized protein YndB with AHSA1/START domain
MSGDRIEREILIDASRERVWAVLTEAKYVAHWFGDRAEIDLKPGGKAKFGWTAYGSTNEALIEEVDPPSFFSYRWTNKSDGELAEGNWTLVEFSLTEVPTGTFLQVVESGFTSLHLSAAEQEKAAKENNEGWTSELAELKEYAERSAA